MVGCPNELADENVLVSRVPESQSAVKTIKKVSFVGKWKTNQFHSWPRMY